MPRHSFIPNDNSDEVQKILKQIKLSELKLVQLELEKSQIASDLRFCRYKLQILGYFEHHDSVKNMHDFMELKEGQKMLKTRVDLLEEKMAGKSARGYAVNKMINSLLQIRKFVSKSEWARAANTTVRSVQNNFEKVEEKLGEKGMQLHTKRIRNSVMVWID